MSARWAVVGLVAAHFSVTADARPIGVDDVLRMEDVGAVVIDPRGRRIVFERVPSPEQRTDFALGEARLAAEIYSYDVARQEPPAAILPGSSSQGRWIGGLSPRGTRLAIYWLEGSALRAGAYDLEARRLVEFAFTPYFDFAQTAPVWISEDELIYATLPAGERPVRPAYRRDAARRLAGAWEDAWRGHKTTADVITSGASARELPMRDGALLRVDARNGRAATIASGLFIGVALSPDGRYLAAVQRGRLQNPDEGRQFSTIVGPYRLDAVLIDLERSGRITRMCESCEVIFSSFEWDSASTALTFFARGRVNAAAHRVYWLFNTLTGQLTAMPHVGLDLVSERERGWEPIPEQAVPFAGGIGVPARAGQNPASPPAFSDRPRMVSDAARIDWYLVKPDGSSRNLTAPLANVSPVLVAARQGALFVLADGDIWRIAADAARKNLTARPGRKLSFSRSRDPEGAEVRNLQANVITAQAAVGGELFVIDLATGSVTVRPVPADAGRLAAASAGAEVVALRRADRAGAAITALTADGRAVPFWRYNRHLSEIEPAPQVTLAYKLPTGEQVSSCALLPAGWASDKRLPVIVHVYPVKHSRCPSYYGRGAVYPYEPEIFAGLGYVVLFPYATEDSLRGEDGPLQNWASVVLPAVDALVHEGYADPDRLGVFGISYGSVSVLALLTQTDRFRAAVASHGAANFTSHYGNLGLVRRLLPNDLFSVGQSTLYESRGTYLWLGSAPWLDPQRFVRASPLFDVARIHTPLMLIHSDLDWNYPMEQFDEVFTALFRLGRDAQYVRYWGEGHGLSSPANVRDMWTRLEAWYAYRLAPRAPMPAASRSP